MQYVLPPVISVCFAILIASLLLVGVASSTVVRHLIQVIAPVLALLSVRRGLAWGSYAALPIFLFWFGIVTLIWLYIFGVSDFASGTYSLAERALTMVMAAACAGGIISIIRDRPAVKTVRASVVLCGFAALQLLLMWLSFNPLVANR